jgi:hypothetical protein
VERPTPAAVQVKLLPLVVALGVVSIRPPGAPQLSGLLSAVPAVQEV